MADMVTQVSVSESEKMAGDQEELEAVGQDVTRHIMVKSSHSSTQGLDKQLVLRRIRHRKRLNKFRAVVGALFSSPFTGDTRHTKYVDEPFTSL